MNDGVRLSSATFEGRHIPLTMGGVVHKGSNNLTILIGKNGTGKSRLLGTICKALLGLGQTRRQYDPLMISDVPDHPEFRLRYYLNDDRHELVVAENRIKSFSINYDDAFKHELSRKDFRIITTTITPFDRFPMEASGAGRSHYYYMGGRSGTSVSNPSSRMGRIAEALMDAHYRNRGNHRKLANLFSLMGYYPQIAIQYDSPKLKQIQDAFSTISAMFARLTKSSGATGKVDVSLRELHENLPKTSFLDNYRLADMYVGDPGRYFALEKAARNVGSYIDRNGSISFRLDFTAAEAKKYDDELYEDIKVLSRNFDTTPNTMFFQRGAKGRRVVNVNTASSGELGMTLLVLGIASRIENNSLVMIDEPEIGLHPEWQERFIELLGNTFNAYTGCHFLIATHSPQIVARSPDDNFVVTMDNLQIQKTEQYFQKSADYQLAELFKAPGYRNQYLAREGLAVLRLIAKRETSDESFKEKVKLLTAIRPLLMDDDPVADMINAIMKLLGDTNGD